MRLIKIVLVFQAFAWLYLLLIGSSYASPEVKVLTANNKRIETRDFRLRLITRTPNQIAAFYEARGFPQYALDELRKVCFITIGLGNKSSTRLYHDVSLWQFHDKAGPVKRFLRSDWKARWAELGLEKRFQSTFRWTLMPEKLDFYPQEGEGGNLIFPRTGNPINIIIPLRVGEGDDARHYQVEFKDIHCATD